MLQEYRNKRPIISKECYIAKTACLAGDVFLNKGVIILPGASLRGDSEKIIIGEYSNIQDNVVIHVSDGYDADIGRNVVIGHGAIVHGATIFDNVLIGMGSIIMNGTVIGENSIIAAGTLIPENKVIPANSLVMGIPGKIIREVTEEEKKEHVKKVMHYYNLGHEIIDI